VVALVLPGGGGEAPNHLVVLGTVTVEVAHPHVDVAPHLAPQRHRQTALVDDDLLVVQRLDHRVDRHGQRDAGLVGVPGVVAHLHDGDAHRFAHLSGGQAGAVCVAHRGDQIVDQRLHLRRTHLGQRDVLSHLAQCRVADRQHLSDAHGLLLARGRRMLKVRQRLFTPLRRVRRRGSRASGTAGGPSAHRRGSRRQGHRMGARWSSAWGRAPCRRPGTSPTAPDVG